MSGGLDWTGSFVFLYLIMPNGFFLSFFSPRVPRNIEGAGCLNCGEIPPEDSRMESTYNICRYILHTYSFAKKCGGS